MSRAYVLEIEVGRLHSWRFRLIRLAYLKARVLWLGPIYIAARLFQRTFI